VHRMCVTSISTFILYTQLSYSQDMRSQRQAVCIALKEIESLSFNMEVIGNLRNLAEDLQSLHMKYSACVQIDTSHSPLPQNYQQCRKSSSTEVEVQMTESADISLQIATNKTGRIWKTLTRCLLL